MNRSTAWNDRIENWHIVEDYIIWDLPLYFLKPKASKYAPKVNFDTYDKTIITIPESKYVRSSYEKHI